ncbi:hypothetical protein [Pseudomonas sp. EZ-C24]|uniref:hypothetical protein n=1 Tax=Pseudomonas sp. EZ-C24 TaxID=2753617 RepID=UPI00165D4076|nr:hypothetical protein [Pseudomonas sp. EZ-C24]
MVQVYEVIAELKAVEFINVGRGTQGRVIRLGGEEQFRIEVDHVVRGVAIPSGAFDTVDEAKAELVRFWSKCNEALQNNPSWMEVL